MIRGRLTFLTSVDCNFFPSSYLPPQLSLLYCRHLCFCTIRTKHLPCCGQKMRNGERECTHCIHTAFPGRGNNIVTDTVDVDGEGCCTFPSPLI